MLMLTVLLSPLVVVLAFALLAALNCPPNCPECGTAISCVQTPMTKTKRQWMQGGYRCSNCDCQMDLRGNIVPRESTASARFVAGIALCTAGFLLLVLLLPATF